MITLVLSIENLSNELRVSFMPGGGPSTREATSSRQPGLCRGNLSGGPGAGEEEPYNLSQGSAHNLL